MSSNTVPIYRHGRKFYVSSEEYERIRCEERLQRRTAAQKSQNLPVSKPCQTTIRSSLYNPLQRSQSNPYESKYGILKTPHIPINSLIHTNDRPESTRLSRSSTRHSNNRNELSSLTSAVSKKKPSITTRSSSSDKILDIRKTQRSSLASHTDNDIKRSFSAEIAQPPPVPLQQQKSRRPIPTTVSDYGISPTTTFSMTPNDQTYTQTNNSKLTSYSARMKQSSLNPPSKSSSGAGSLFETSMQGLDHVYTILGTSNRCPGSDSSSLLARSNSDNSKNEYYYRDTTSGDFSDENSSTLSMLYQRKNLDANRYQPSEYIVETDNNFNLQRDLWTRSTIRSQSSDGLTEKKRVRFADMEGFTLETEPDKKQLRSPINNRLLTRRQHVKALNHSRGQPSPLYNGFLQTATKTGQSKLATDV